MKKLASDDVTNLIRLAQIYADAVGKALGGLSNDIFEDGKKIESLINGGDITTGRKQYAMQWLSDHWPQDLKWPKDIDRPAPNKRAA